MEAFAAHQSAKRKRAESIAAAESAKLASAKRRSREEEIKFSVALGFLPPPTHVFAAGKDESAAVWWMVDGLNLEGKVGWEVHRYRRDASLDRDDPAAWQYKGLHAYTDLPMLQVNITELTNNYEYRFTVKTVNEKGAGLESPPSNPVMVESPLPGGWYRFKDGATGRYYYASVKTNRSSWTRPELHPYFVDDSLFVHFQPHEIDHLRELFDEDMAHFQYVSFAQFMDGLRECGERCPGKMIKRLFKAYADDTNKLSSWTQYMEIMAHIKRIREDPPSILGSIMEFFARQRVQRILKPNRDKLGRWKMEYSELAARFYYLHSDSGEISWLMPDDVKFYIPLPLLNKLLKVFDINDIEEFKQYFSSLDIDCSGDLSDKEIKLLLDMMGIPVTPNSLAKLIKAIDINRNGTVEFDEFCWMMYELRRNERSRGAANPTAALSFGSRNTQIMPDDDEEDSDREDNDDNGDEETSISRRLSIFNSGKWNAVTFSTMQKAVFNLRSKDSDTMQPDAPSSPTTAHIDITARNTAINSMEMAMNALPRPTPLWKRLLCCVKDGPAPYVLHARPPDIKAGSSSTSQKSGRRMSFAGKCVA